MTLRSGGKVTTSFRQNVTVEVVAVGLDSEGRLVAVENLSSIGNAGKVAVARYLTLSFQRMMAGAHVSPL
jgi:hypothetical protein